MTRLGVALLTLLSSLQRRPTRAEPFNINGGRDRVTSLGFPNVDDLEFASPFHSSHQQAPGGSKFELLDTLLVASVDGKFHAVNRTSGAIQWSMTAAAPATDSADDQPAPRALSPLVRTDHVAHPDADEDGDDFDTYVIEPQTGDIYIVPSHGAPDEPLQKLGISMEQLVEYSPFTLAEPGQKKRQFLGKKETALLTIDIRTGDIKSYVNSDNECRWDEYEQESTALEPYRDEELEGVTPKKSPTVSIARTDYYVKVIVGNRNVQRLAYSVYGPNNVDRATQAQWTQTPDDRYMQADPTGYLYAFSTSSQSRERNAYWQLPHFDHPIAAIFDVVRMQGLTDPIALLQPKPRIAEVMTDKAQAQAHYSRLMDRTYIGLVENSLFAMSANTFPLVSFVGKDRALDASHSSKGDEHNHDHWWHDDCTSQKCLVGRWRTRDVSSESRLDRLLDPPAPSPPQVFKPGDLATPSAPQPPERRHSTPVESRITELPDPPPGSYFQRSSSKTFAPLVALGVAALLWLVVRSRPVTIKFEADWSSKTAASTAAAPVTPVLDSQPPHDAPVPAPTTSVTSPEVADVQDQAADGLVADDSKDAEDDDKEDGATPKRKRVRKRTRKPKGKSNNMDGSGDGPELAVDTNGADAPIDAEYVQIVLPPPLLSPSPLATPRPQATSLVVSETVLGFGSHGTIVYQGAFQGRAVAVKRLLGDFVTLATREVQLLQESDDHPNVIRYFYKEQRDNFLYIALELCPASLADVVERPDVFRDISIAFDPKKALSQVTAGLRHLHSLKIVHRDIKPQNILVSHAKNGVRRMLISDFGLCKKLDSDQTSFMPTMHGAMAAGTVGWRAPEILRGDVKLDDQSPDDSSRGSSSGTSSIAGTTAKRLTKSVDVFALGCLFYYTLTNGDHPYGDRFNRERNIMKNEFRLDELERLGEEGVEAMDLISKMLDPEPKARPDTLAILLHPFFWTPGRRLNFLQDASDRFEIMCRAPREQPLIVLETGAYDVVGADWHSRLDRIFIENLGKFRKYDGKAVQDLLRALRNKKHHYQDLPDHVKRHVGSMPDGFLAYFTRRFPALFLHVHTVVSDTGLDREPMFRSYFELAES